ncbi:MAG TPA: alpha/beta hydrolase-fold protein [Sedimentisphaerales bacterium]|nr:alpha/beta hydrolase-fold protein [Sedimentisphaerales bacterium]HNU29175.1 alpha/beta hydrolase-fold protein [Sedimentisphaerales bacterium]
MPRGLFIGCGLAVLLTISNSCAFAQAAGGSPGDTSFSPKSGLLLTTRGERGRGGPPAFGARSQDDPLRSKLVDGTLAEFHPQEGQTVEGARPQQWTPVEFGPDGAVAGRGSYLYAPIVSDRQRVLILNASGQSTTYVNGEPRGGDIYNAGYMHLPVLLREGTNSLFLRTGRGAMKVRLYKPPAPVFLHREDLTLPDLVVEEESDAWGAVVVVNATPEPATGFTLVLRASGVADKATPVPAIIPLTVRKVGFRIRAEAPAGEGRIEGTLELHGRDGALCHSMPLSLEIRRPDQHRKITFLSDIDGSVQYFALRPAVPASPDDPAPAIALSCHGAGVDAAGQAASYSPKSWCHVVAPTNRRPYGYDWEDFGRMDAMEVLAIAKGSLRHDPSRIYLTGHSMGGHGTWHLGVTYPDCFAAIGPSAGWLSRSSYGGPRGEREDDSPMGLLLARCRTAQDTVALSANLKQQGVYILHGGGDDNVPAAEAQTMTEVLQGFHHDWTYHEEPGMGHWWGNAFDDGGTACVDWPFMFDWFARHALPPSSAVREVEFVTANPGVSSRCHWLAIEGQIRHLDLSKAHVQLWPNKRLFKGTTENVAVLRLDVSPLLAKQPVTVDLDGQTLADIPFPTGAGSLWFARQNDRWQAVNRPSARSKGPGRYGATKDELKHRFLFVYGTHGTREENAWSLGKARYDAETFWYRGNGSVEIVQDSAFSPSRYPDRTVVLYGNAETNGAWTTLVGNSPVQVRRGRVQVGDRAFRGDDLSVLFVRPRPDSDVASVVVIGGSGPAGMRAAYPVSLFVSSVRYPDCLVTRPGGTDARSSENVAVGFFGLDWSVENGEFAFETETEPAAP